MLVDQDEDITVVHGDHHVSSRCFLYELIDE
jgi:hypothetical protein